MRAPVVFASQALQRVRKMTFEWSLRDFFGIFCPPPTGGRHDVYEAPIMPARWFHGFTRSESKEKANAR